MQIGSALASRSVPLQSVCCGAKHGINGFTSSVRAELMHSGSNLRITIAQMPAVNTPQFSWVLSRLSGSPRPVAPIYQPQVAAQVVLYAADHPGRKQFYVGASAAATILANKIAPVLLDRYLARTGYDSQQTDQPDNPQRRHNLWAPADDEKDHGAHGDFRRPVQRPRPPTVVVPPTGRPSQRLSSQVPLWADCLSEVPCRPCVLEA